MQPSRCTVAAHEGHIDKTAYKDMFFFSNERYVKSLSQSTSKLDIQGQILKVCLKVQANAYTGRSNILPLIQQYNLLHLPLPPTLAAVYS